MKGDQHLITGAAVATFSVAAYQQITNSWSNANAVDLVINLKNFIVPENIILGTVAILLYIIGLLAPDCDSPNSTLGRFIYIPVEHRTWLHTLWFVITFLIIGIFFRPFIAFMLGYLVHLIFDSPSKCGICWLYPISKYKKYPNGGKVKKGHVVILYWNDLTAYVLCFFVWVITICYVLGIMNIVPSLHTFVIGLDSKVETLVSFFVH